MRPEVHDDLSAMHDPESGRRLAEAPATIGQSPDIKPKRERGRRRYVIWLALIPAAFAAYFWPWPTTWIETGLLLMLIACLFVIDEMSRF